MADPVVSVVTIFRNAPVVFFEEAIASVLAQTEANFELLLVDDGSTDGCTEVARRAAARHPERISLLFHPHGAHRGMSASRNLGVAAAGVSSSPFSTPTTSICPKSWRANSPSCEPIPRWVWFSDPLCTGGVGAGAQPMPTATRRVDWGWNRRRSFGRRNS